MISKILVPVDGSSHADLAAEKAAEIAEKFNAKVTFYYVIFPPSRYMVVDIPPDFFQNLLDEMEKQGQDLLARYVEKYQGRVSVSSLIDFGHPADMICRRAEEDKYDMIVIGSRGLGAIKGYLLGSVSDRVSHHARVSVLIVK